MKHTKTMLRNSHNATSIYISQGTPRIRQHKDGFPQAYEPSQHPAKSIPGPLPISRWRDQPEPLPLRC